MRVERIVCDVCKKEHNAEYLLPYEWIRTLQRTAPYGDEVERHFCSKVCLSMWAQGEEGTKTV